MQQRPGSTTETWAFDDACGYGVLTEDERVFRIGLARPSFLLGLPLVELVFELPACSLASQDREQYARISLKRREGEDVHEVTEKLRSRVTPVRPRDTRHRLDEVREVLRHAACVGGQGEAASALLEFHVRLKNPSLGVNDTLDRLVPACGHLLAELVDFLEVRFDPLLVVDEEDDCGERDDEENYGGEGHETSV